MKDSNPVLIVENLTKQFSSFTAVNSISFQLGAGEILGFLGPNGAGKTTTIQMLLGVMSPTGGTISYFGKNFTQHRSEIMQHVSFASAYVQLPGHLTIAENLAFYGELYGINKAEREANIKELLTFFGMWDLRNKRTGQISAGQMTRVILAKAFLVNPRIVLLDEPTASLDPDIVVQVRSFVLQQRKERGISVLFTSHNMADVATVCDRVLILKSGSIIADNTPEQLAQSVAQAKVELVITEGYEQAQQYAQEKSLVYELKEHNTIIIATDEHKIAELLMGLARAHVMYAQISIAKPTLEDYFIKIAQK